MKRFIFLLLVPIPVTVLAQTETTEWWVNGEIYATTSCETGGDISTPPQNPTKKGHTFQGWETAVYDMSTLDVSINATDGSSKNGGNNWVLKFSYGSVYGERLCLSTKPTSIGWYTNVMELDTKSEGQYCYVRVTEFIPVGSTKIYEPLNSPIVFYQDMSSVSNCKTWCLMAHVNFYRDIEMRRKIFAVP